MMNIIKGKVIGVVNNESEIRFEIVKMADEIWRMIFFLENHQITQYNT